MRHKEHGARALRAPGHARARRGGCSAWRSMQFGTGSRAGSDFVEARPAWRARQRRPGRTSQGPRQLRRTIVLPAWSKAVESAALEAASSSTRGSDCTPSGLASSWECTPPSAARRALRRPRSRAGALRRLTRFDHAVLQLSLAQPRRRLAHVAALDDHPPGVLMTIRARCGELHAIAFQRAALAPEESLQEQRRRRRG